MPKLALTDVQATLAEIASIDYTRRNQDANRIMEEAKAEAQRITASANKLIRTSLERIVKEHGLTLPDNPEDFKILTESNTPVAIEWKDAPAAGDDGKIIKFPAKPDSGEVAAPAPEGQA